MSSDEMKPKGRYLKVLGGVGAFIGGMLLLVAALTLIPVGPEHASFVSVTSPDRYTDFTASSRLPGRPHGDHVIHNDKLYLKVQGTRGALVLVTTVRFYPWTASRLQQFRAEHPELERYLPDPAKPNAGIAWVTE